MTSMPDIYSVLDPRRDAPNAARYTRRLLSGAKRWKYDALIVLWIVAALYFWLWWLNPAHVLPGMRYWVVTLAFAWLYFLQAYFVFIFRAARVPSGELPDPATTRVAIIVTKTPSEPFSVVKRTLQAMLDQTYPHDTWLADEDPHPETVAWCEAHGVQISSRKGKPEYHRKEWPFRTRCKEGNLAHFYETVGYDRYDIVSQLDADHAPSPTYLAEIMRGFADPDVGYVTAPSICANNQDQSWAARTRLHTEAGFHGIFQAGYAALLSPMCIGSHYAVRTKALRDVGGLGPELAEDHSTTLLMNAGGWRGVHAMDAIAVGDGPANVSDLCTQEFQWSRSLLTLLLRYTPTYFANLRMRHKFQFAFCQALYPIFGLFMLVCYLVPIFAVLFDMRYAAVTFPEFVLHAVWAPLVLMLIAYALRLDGFFRPTDAKVLGWEKALFLALQWPWVLWGCISAVRDRITGQFVDFRITPKGEAAEATLPYRVLLPYLVLALGCILPVLLVDTVKEAKGFYALTLLNGLIYTALVSVIVIRHLKDNRIAIQSAVARVPGQLVSVPVLAVLMMSAISLRGPESVMALSVGLGKDQMVEYKYVVSGAGMGAAGDVRYRWNPTFFPSLFTSTKEQ